MRLTNTLRKAILTAALKKSGLTDRKDATRAKYAEWAETVRLLYVGNEAAVKDLLFDARAVYSKIPDAVKGQYPRLNMETAIRANVAGQRRTIYWCGADKWENAVEESCGDAESRVSPSHDHVTFAGDHPLAIALFEIDAEVVAVAKETESLTAQINAVLHSVTTDAQLYKVWPEAVAFTPQLEKAAAISTLPAVLVADLNKALGLP